MSPTPTDPIIIDDILQLTTDADALGIKDLLDLSIANTRDVADLFIAVNVENLHLQYPFGGVGGVIVTQLDRISALTTALFNLARAGETAQKNNQPSVIAIHG